MALTQADKELLDDLQRRTARAIDKWSIELDVSIEMDLSWTQRADPDSPTPGDTAVLTVPVSKWTNTIVQALENHLNSLSFSFSEISRYRRGARPASMKAAFAIDELYGEWREFATDQGWGY